MSLLDSVLVALGFDSKGKITAFKELLKLTECYAILEEDEKGFENKSVALTRLVELTQGTDKKPAWLRKKERWENEDTDDQKKDRGAYLNLFTQLELCQKKEPSQKNYGVVLLFGAKRAAVEGRLDYLVNLLNSSEGGIKVGKLVLLGGQRPLDGDEISSLPSEEPSQETELNMMQALVKQFKTDKKLTDDIEIVPIDTLNKEDGKRPNTADTIKKWLEDYKPSPNTSVLAISNQPYICYQDAVLKAVLDENNLLDSITVETVGSVMDPNEKIVTVLDTLARYIYSSRARLEKLFVLQQAQASYETEKSSSQTQFNR